jgi:hypothetical protein
MTTTQLKRYKIKPECWIEFKEVWVKVVALRKRHEFGVLFALEDRETNWFTWAINHEGDFDAAAENYYKDPDRVTLDIIVDYVSENEIRKVQALDIP